MSKQNYRTYKKWNHIKCDLCGEHLTNHLDLVLYNSAGGKIIELEFRHQVRCDDKSFQFSRHVKDGYEDILDNWYREENNNEQSK